MPGAWVVVDECCDGTGVDDNHQHLNNFSANVQNVYMREVGYAHTLSKLKNLVACNSLPSSDSAKLNPSTQKISLSGTYNGGDIIIGITTGTHDHNFFSGDAIYYTPQLAANGTVMSFLFGEGLYFVERINHNDIKLAKSLSNLYDGNYQKISEATVQTTITNNTFEKYDFHGKIVQPQKLFREFDMPTYDGKRYPTKIGYNGLLINGTEVLEDIKNKKQVVFVSGHFNNFELMAMQIENYGINIAALYRPLNNIFLNKTMENIRINHICKKQIKKGKSGTREMFRLLKKGYSIALMIDQRVGEGITINLFNRKCLTTTIPAQLIKKYNCGIVPVYIERKNNINFEISFSKIIEFEKNHNIENITLELNLILECLILINIDQWIWSHNRWK